MTTVNVSFCCEREFSPKTVNIPIRTECTNLVNWHSNNYREPVFFIEVTVSPDNICWRAETSWWYYLKQHLVLLYVASKVCATVAIKIKAAPMQLYKLGVTPSIKYSKIKANTNWKVLTEAIGPARSRCKAKVSNIWPSNRSSALPDKIKRWCLHGISDSPDIFNCTITTTHPMFE